MSSAVTAASSATGMSEVPAEMTPIRAPVGSGGVRETTTRRAVSFQVASGTSASTARAASGETRVASVCPAVFASARTMAATCAGVLPSASTTSGNPRRTSRW